MNKVSERTCEQRSCVLRQVHKKLATKQPLYIESEGIERPLERYAWLKDTDHVLAATTQAYPNY